MNDLTSFLTYLVVWGLGALLGAGLVLLEEGLDWLIHYALTFPIS